MCFFVVWICITGNEVTAVCSLTVQSNEYRFSLHYIYLKVLIVWVKRTQ